MRASARYRLSLAGNLTLAVLLGSYLFAACLIIGNAAYIHFSCSDVVSLLSCKPRSMKLLTNNDVTLFKMSFATIVSGLANTIVALPQLFIVAVPVALGITKGPKSDAQRHMLFYILAGMLIGGGPWALFAAMTYVHNESFGANFGYAIQALGVGALSGVALKWLLMRNLKFPPRIESSIK